jgi:phospholipase/carboxylesterase
MKERHMAWMRFSRGHWLDPVAEGAPEAVAVLLHGPDDASATVLDVAARWAPAVPTTAFVVLDAIEPVDLLAGPGPLLLDPIARQLQPVLARLDGSRLVLVGFSHGGTVALHLVLRHGSRCAGVLAFAPRLMETLPRALRIDAKIRLIDSPKHHRAGDVELRDAIAALAARGIDARGVLLSGAILSDEAVRHGGAYLAELIATAQRGDQFHVLAQEPRHGL